MRTQFKKVLSMALVLCMVLSLFPVSAFAAGTDETQAVASQPVAEAASESTETELAPAAATAAVTSSLTMGTKPADGTTTGNPFVQGTGDSNSFRIPAMVTLNDGTIVAAADARWNTTYDGGGLDTIVSYSTDNGSNWNYTFANYLGDNGNVYNGSGSTAFIDPALATDGSTVYMLCDLYPYGIALNGSENTAPSTAVGFNSDGTLKLAASGSYTYNYYLKDGQIYDSSNSVVSGYTVDAYFNITGNGYDTNLFFSDSPYQVVRTGYLYLTSSSDGGKTWSEPMLIPNVKNSSEKVCLVGPGRGLVTGGKIIFPVYSYNGSSSSQQMGFIYSSDGGETWTRSANFTGDSWSSEAAVVELEDGILRFFYRNGNSQLCYADYTWGNGWGSAVKTGIATNSNTQISAITLTKTVDDKQVILVSCPTGSNSAGSADSSASARLNGKIFVGLLNSDNTIAWQSDKAISVTSNNSQFMYSCLTELSDGKVAILYENQESAWGTGSNCYYTMDFQTYDLGLTFDKVADDNIYVENSDDNTGIRINFGSNSYESVTVTSVTPDVLDGKTYVAYDINVTGFAGTSATVTIPLNDAFEDDAELQAVYINDDGVIADYIEGNYDTKADTFTFTATHFSTYAVVPKATDSETTTPVEVILTVGESKTITDKTGNYENADDNTEPDTRIATMTVTGTSAITETTVSTTAATELEDGSTYLICLSSYTNYAMTSNIGRTDWGTRTLVCEQHNSTASDTNMWTLEAADGGYKIKCAAGYLNLGTGNNTAYVDTTGEIFEISWTGSAWTIKNPSGEYINHLGGTAYGYTIGGYTSDGTTLNFYKVTKSTEASTTITFKGVAVGTTTAKVGDTTYNITVEKAKKTVNVAVGGTEEFEDASSNVTVSDSTVATATLSNGTLTITGVAEGTTTVTTDTTIYDVEVVDAILDPSVITGSADITGTHDNKTQTCPVGGKVITSMVLTVGISYDLDTSLTNLTWTSADPSIATVDQSGNVTAVAVGETTITVLGTDGSGNKTFSTIHVTVIAGPTSETTRTAAFYVDEIASSTVYCSINGGTDLFKIYEGELIYGKFNSSTSSSTDSTTTTAFSFFAAPDEGYAVTYMDATNSDGNYYLLHTGDHSTIGNGSDYYYNTSASTGAGYWQAVGLGGNSTTNPNWDAIKNMVEAAIKLGCDGGQGFTRRQAEGALCQGVSFRSDKLPELVKKITSIQDASNKDVTDGAKVKIGYTIYYTIDVYVPVNQTEVITDGVTSKVDNITYSDIFLSDPLTSDEWTSSTSEDNDDTNDGFDTITGVANATVTSFTYVNSAGETVTYTGETTKYSFTTSLMLTQENFATVVKDGTITNTAALNYSYKANYSKGSAAAEASAVADVTVDIPKFVVDFGLPLQIDMSDYQSGTGNIIADSVNATYGDCTLNGDVITYTPNRTLEGVDYVKFKYQLSNSPDQYEYQIAIIPATTVYYEEEFANYSETGWNKTLSNETLFQTASKLGDGGSDNSETKNAARYGYDPAYNSSGASNGTQMTSNSDSAWATFKFTGTGVDIYSECTQYSGKILVLITHVVDGMNATEALMQIDTQAIGDYADMVENNAYNTVIASVTGLTHGEHTVSMRAMDNKGVNIDGFRVYGTLDVENSEEKAKVDAIYAQDLEDKPTFIEMRDKVLAGLNVDIYTSVYADQIVNYYYSQVYASGSSTEGAVVLDANGYTTSDVQKLLDNGPKNELYLTQNQTLTFKVNTNRVVQIGLKAPNTSTTCTINSTKYDINSSTDMFYPVLNKAGAASEQTITITNTGTGILSITKLKICDDPNATLAPLTAEDLVPALVSLGFKEEPKDDKPSDSGRPSNPGMPPEPEKPFEPEKPSDPALAENPFTDVEPEQWYTEPVLWAVQKGITKGMTDTIFSPDTPCTRAQAVTFLWRAMGCPEPESTENPFTDIKEGTYYYNAVLWAFENEITTGLTDTTFGPEDPCSRAQVVTFLWRCAGKPESKADATFTDLTEDYYMDAVAWAVENIITDGTGENKFSPEEKCNRAHIVTFLHRYLADSST